MNRELLKELMYTHGISGRENGVANLIKSKIEKHVDSVETDKVGNLIAHKRGDGKRLLFVASMDSVGFFADYIMPNGDVRVSSIRGLSYDGIKDEEVVSQNGVTGKIVPDSDDDELNYTSVHIDIGAKDRCEAESLVKVTDSFTFEPSLRKLDGTKYVGNPFDNRISCYALIEAIRKIKKQGYDLYFGFETQREDMHPGSRNIVYRVEPDYVIYLDVATGKQTKIGEGAAIKVKDKGGACSEEIIELIEEASERKKVPTQYDINDSYSSALSELRTIKRGCEVGGISVPCEKNHTSSEKIDFKDVEGMISIINGIIEVE